MEIVILSPGQMGAAVGAALADAGHVVGWLPGGRGPETRQRAERAGLVERDGLAGCDLVLSICPPGAAVEVAGAAAGLMAGWSGWYVDANAISPATADAVRRAVAGSGATYVDGGIIGLPPVAAGTTRLYLSGPDAAVVAEVFSGSRVEALPLAGPPYAASSLKMAYAAWTKVRAALLVAARSTAAAEGVEQALVAEWARSQPGLDAEWLAATASVAKKGWRWQAEMVEVANTFGAAGQPEGFGRAAAVFARYERPAD